MRLKAGHRRGGPVRTPTQLRGGVPYWAAPRRRQNHKRRDALRGSVPCGPSAQSSALCWAQSSASSALLMTQLEPSPQAPWTRAIPWSPMLQSSGAPCGTGKTRDTCAQPPNQGRTALHLSASAAAPARVPCPRPVPAAIVTASRVQAKAESLNGPQSARMRFPPRIGSSRRPRYQNLTYAFGRATARA
jgi:hypothetical protein